MQHLIPHRRNADLCQFALLFIATCLAGIFWPGQASAATGTMADDAQVLNTEAIQKYTDPFSYTVDIFTTNVFQGTNDDFDASVKALTSNTYTIDSSTCDPTHQVGCKLFSSQTIPAYTYPGSNSSTSTSTSYMQRNGDADQSVEIGIDVSTRHLAIYSGSSVTIAQNHYDQAIQSFADTMHQTHDNYTQATIAALNALQSASDRFWNGVHAALPWIFFGVLIIGSIIWSFIARSLGIRSSSRYYGWSNTSSGGGGNSGGGGGGGGASGNF